MGRISWSQVQQWKSCPYKWKLAYVDGHRQWVDNIYTVYGKALHATMQTYLEEMYNESIVKADKLDLPNMLLDRLKYYYSEGVKAADGKHFSTQKELSEFCIQGAKGLEWFKKHRADYFQKKNWELVGIEVQLEEKYRHV